MLNVIPIVNHAMALIAQTAILVNLDLCSLVMNVHKLAPLANLSILLINAKIVI